jgi:hypothetical protein
MHMMILALQACDYLASRSIFESQNSVVVHGIHDYDIDDYGIHHVENCTSQSYELVKACSLLLIILS